MAGGEFGAPDGSASPSSQAGGAGESTGMASYFSVLIVAALEKTSPITPHRQPTSTLTRSIIRKIYNRL